MRERRQRWGFCKLIPSMKGRGGEGRGGFVLRCCDQSSNPAFCYNMQQKHHLSTPWNRGDVEASSERAEMEGFIYAPPALFTWKHANYTRLPREIGSYSSIRDHANWLIPLSSVFVGLGVDTNSVHILWTPLERRPSPAASVAVKGVFHVYERWAVVLLLYIVKTDGDGEWWRSAGGGKCHTLRDYEDVIDEKWYSMLPVYARDNRWLVVNIGRSRASPGSDRIGIMILSLVQWLDRAVIGTIYDKYSVKFSKHVIHLAVR